MDEKEKIAELARQLGQAFPGFVVKPPTSEDDYGRWPFRVEWNADLTRSKSFTVPWDAVHDLEPAEIVAFVETTDWWDREPNPGHVLHIGYDVQRGLCLPE